MMRDAEQIMTKEMPQMKLPTHEQKCLQQRNCLDESVKQLV